ncbi:hypothetical protein IID04_07585 [PVC group bacterium]|nr:hypothetical protein [PVC group bacterium]
MAGEIKHTWTIKNVERFRVVTPIKDGNLIVVGDTIFQLDWDSTLMWDASVYGHHDFAFLPDESFYALTTDSSRDLNGYSLLFDSIVHISKEGDNLGVVWSSYAHKNELDKFYSPPSFSLLPDEERKEYE